MPPSRRPGDERRFPKMWAAHEGATKVRPYQPDRNAERILREQYDRLQNLSLRRNVRP